VTTSALSSFFGTSAAAPHVAGAAALVKSEDPTATANIIQTLLEDNTASAPQVKNNNDGVGRVDVGFLVGFSSTPPNPLDAPDAVDDSVATITNFGFLIEPLLNDNDPNGDDITIFDFTEPLHGFIANNPIFDGDITYFPDLNFAGVDYLNYTITDGFGGFDSANVTITIPGDLYVASELGSQIVRYDGTTTQPLGIFGEANSIDSTLDEPIDLTFGSFGDLYVTSSFTDEILVYDGATGVFIEDFVTAGSGGLVDPAGLAFGGGNITSV